jgi:hypothetical protein
LYCAELLDQRFPGEAVLVDVADEIAVAIALSEPHRLSVAVDPGAAPRRGQQSRFDTAALSVAIAHWQIQSQHNALNVNRHQRSALAFEAPATREPVFHAKAKSRAAARRPPRLT